MTTLGFLADSRVAATPASPIREVRQRAAELEERGRDVLHLELGEPDFDSPSEAKAAAVAALEAGRVHYTANAGEPWLREAIARKLSADNGLDYDPASEIVVTNGGGEALFATFMAVLGPGDEVVLPEPAWPHYRACALLAGARPVAVPTDPTSNVPDPEAVAAAVTDRTRVLVVNSPNNPTGAVYPVEVLAALGDLAVRHDLVVLSDEIYERLVYEGEHVSVASIDGLRSRTVTLNGFSKAYAMTGWRLAYVAAPTELSRLIVRVHQYTTVCAPEFVQAGGAAAYEGDQSEAAAMRDAFARRRRIVVEGLQRVPGLGLVPPSGAFYAFPRIVAPRWDSRTLSRHLLEEAGVATVPGDAFGAAGEGHLRLSFAAADDVLEEAVRRIGRLMSERQ